MREHVVYEVCRCLDHAPGPATRAEAAALAGERDEVLVATAVALHVDEAVFQSAAREVVMEHELHEPRRRHIT